MKLLLIMVLLLVPQLAAARVYMCVDPGTGKTSFTDKACAAHAPGEKVKVTVANPGSAARTPRKNPNKVWQSQRDSSKSGLDHNQGRRQMHEDKATAIAATGGS